MKEQNYSNHKRYDLLYHGFTFILIVILGILSVYNLYISAVNSQGVTISLMFLLISLIILMLFFYIRIYSLKAQDRAIRAEENLRYFVIKGKLLDNRLTVQQILALRFASDEEFPVLAERALSNNLKSDDIKREIKNWRADNYRV
ncbi:MAG: hypothetical protein JNJ56_13295 [Ignavibacteria bacterium]|nr:hypothetical protein [Ignavibacteria bacterium]